MKILIVCLVFITSFTFSSEIPFLWENDELWGYPKKIGGKCYMVIRENEQNVPIGSYVEVNIENGVINYSNPFENETRISYYIPSDYSGKAELMLTDEKGSSIIQKLDACIGKPCSISIFANGLNAGVYVYSLVIDGNIIKSKKMMIIK